jgi:DNA-binding transcriptional MerR regulator
MSGRATLAAMPAASANGAAEADEGDGRGKPKKAPNAFRTISEVADELHIPQHVLRFWETKFPQVKPLKRGGGRRYYRPDDIALLRRVSDLLYIQGYTIKGVQRLLREGGGKLSDDIPPPSPEEREDQEAQAAAMPEIDAPELPMPGLTPAAPAAATPAPARRQAGRGAAREEAAAPDASAAEAERLRLVLASTLRELEALRALLP